MTRYALLLLAVLTGAHANETSDELATLLANQHTQAVATPAVNATLASIKNLQTNYYLLLVYKGSCSHCHNLAPVLKDFASTFRLDVVAYSLDDQSLPGFKGLPLTADLFNALFITGGYKAQVPALFLVNRHTLEAYAVLFGEAQDYQLARRIDELMSHIEEKYHE